jgi:hypothetical protein
MGGDIILKRIFAKVRPSPAMAVALLGVALGFGSTGWAANGGAFILGVINGATQRTFLGANYNGPALRSATPLPVNSRAIVTP